MYYVLLRGDSADKVCCMKHFFRTFNWKDYLFFSVCGVAYYFLIRQYLVLWDDMEYPFICGVEGHNYIYYFSDIISSQIHHYIHINGRFLIHCMVQWFCSYGDLELYFLISTIFFILILINCSYLIKRRTKNKNGLVYSVLFLALLYLLMPVIGSTFFGSVAFVCNYMYSCAVYLLFYAIYIHIKEDKVNYKWYINLLLFFFGIACGSWHESFSIGISGALLIYHSIDLYINKNFKEKFSLFFLVLGFGIGTLIVVLAPGNFVRAETVGIGPINIISRLKGIIFHPFVIVTIFTLIIACFIDMRKGNKWAFIKKESLIIIALFITYIFDLVITYTASRQLTMPALFGVYLIITFLCDYADSFITKFNKVIGLLCIVICLIIYIPSLRYMYLLNKAENAFIEDALTNKTAVVIDYNFEYIDRYVIPNGIIRKYINSDYTIDGIYCNQFYTKKLSAWMTNGQTDTICTLLLPEPMENIITKCTNDNLVSDNIWHSDELNYYILRLPIDVKANNCTICFTVQPVTLFQKVKYKILGSKVYRIGLYIPTQEIRHFEYNNYNYYVFSHHNLYDALPAEMYIEYM